MNPNPSLPQSMKMELTFEAERELCLLLFTFFLVFLLSLSPLEVFSEQTPQMSQIHRAS
jgi:hypothetical protein